MILSINVNDFRKKISDQILKKKGLYIFFDYYFDKFKMSSYLEKGVMHIKTHTLGNFPYTRHV